MSNPKYQASYLKAQYPRGQIRTARSVHICNGVPDDDDPGCRGRIEQWESFFDTGRRDQFKRGHRFCKRCAMIGCNVPDLFIDQDSIDA